MTSQAPTSSDRSRTYWTPIMERYFVDLMLEHMHRGNRTGHTFNKQAWIDMLSVFNAKFGAQYDKDVLKGRYTNLWKQFNDVKNLLGHGGFSWDEFRQMVVADDYIWDDYIKAHPDARQYKTKPVFSDLCLIYGYTTADGRYSRSSHDIDTDDEVQGANFVITQSTCSPDDPYKSKPENFSSLQVRDLELLAPSNTERARTDWTTSMDQYFIELMLDQQEKGNKLDNTYSKQAWNDMLTSFYAKFGPQHTKRVLRHRYKKLGKYYNDTTVLLKQNGFSWDEKEQVIAADDDVWDALVKAHPHLRSYRTKSLPNYKQLELIFGSTINTQSLNRDKDIEDVGMKSGSERSRTYWTPPMDRHLIGLLLEQVNSGNRIGQTFVAQAWIGMVTSFNMHFRSHHDNDVLKNRYKHLKRQYNDIKILLEQTGFSWDEAREMVAAEDHIWDAYIEVHPDARSYRVKTVPSYRKLCLIYSQDSSEGRYSCLACNGERKDDQLAADTEPNCNWTPAMGDCFIELMLAQVQRENHIFDDQTWVDVTKSFNEKCGQNYEKSALQNHYACLMKQYSDIKSLLDQKGFSWDDTQQIVVADDDVWEACSKVEPHAISYRGIILGHYKALCLIFGSTIRNVGINYDETSGTEFIHTHHPVDMQIIEVDKDVLLSVRDIDASYERKKRSAETMPSISGRPRKVQRNEQDDMQEAFTDMANEVPKLVNRTVDKNYIAIERSVDSLQAIPDMDDELLLDACDLLEDDKRAKTFLALDVSIRKKWFLRKLGRC